jgi:CMP-N-acetylneuraminic acid synthetase
MAYVMSKEHSVDLDTPLDWKFAELLLKESL